MGRANMKHGIGFFRFFWRTITRDRSNQLYYAALLVSIIDCNLIRTSLARWCSLYAYGVCLVIASYWLYKHPRDKREHFRDRARMDWWTDECGRLVQELDIAAKTWDSARVNELGPQLQNAIHRQNREVEAYHKKYIKPLEKIFK